MAVRRPALLATGYYLLLGLLLVLVVTRALPHLLPAGVARHVGSDSERYLLALLLPYVQPRRRPGVGAALGLGTLLAVAVVLLGHTPLAHLDTALAEGTVLLVLAPLVLDAVDRDVLGSGSLPWRGRAALLVALAVVPLTVVALRHAALPGWAHDGVGYLARAQEAFVGMWLVVAYLGVHRALARPAPPAALGAPRLLRAAA
jgi:hypothetical protein